jgi:hypothetical protein
VRAVLGMLLLVALPSCIWSQAFHCQYQGEAWPQLQPNQSQVIRSGSSAVTFRLAVQPASGSSTGVYAVVDGVQIQVSSAPNFTQVAGRRIEIVNRSGSVQNVCFVGGAVHSATGKSGFHCQDNQGASLFRLAAGEQKTIYSGPSRSLRLVTQPAAGFDTGVVVGLTGYSLNVPSAPSVIEVEDSHVDLFNRRSDIRQGCILQASDNSATVRPATTPALKKASRTISATVDLNGNQHPGTVAVRGPASITCLSATQSALQHPGDQPPACFVTGPGLANRLEKGQNAGSTGAGTISLICNGQGRLTCSAKVDD